MLLQNWLRSHLREWNAKTREDCGLDMLVSLDLARFPIDQSALNPDEEIRQLRNVHPGTKDVLAMFVEGILWGGITVETDITCPNCQGRALIFLEDTKRDEILLTCDQCSWLQTPGGVHIATPREFGTLQAVTTARLEKYRDTGH